MLRQKKYSLLLWRMLMISIGCVAGCSSPVPGQPLRDPAKAQMQEMSRRQIQLSNISEKGPANDPKRAQALMDQVSEDFQRILLRHNEMVRAIDGNLSIDYRFIAEATSEIRKRSMRLQSSLKLERLEASGDDQKNESLLGGMDTKEQMILLCKQIEAFVKNPIIDKPGIFDAQALEKARKDLQSIVEITDVMKKHADKRIH